MTKRRTAGDPRRPARPDGGGRRRADPRAEPNVTVEGRRAVAELLRAGRRRTVEVLVAETVTPSDAVAEIVALASAAGVPVRRVPRARIQALAGTEAPQGVVAVAEPLPEADLEQLARVVPGQPAPLLVVLDGVTDPHNLGAVMRSALCAGATGVVVGRHRSASVGPVATKVAAGAAEWLPVAVAAGIPGAVASLRSAGVWAVGLDAGADRSLWDLDLGDQPVALVLGSEGRGLSRLSAKRCDVVVGVPMLGPLGSLNVAAAGTLACFEVARRRQRG